MKFIRILFYLCCMTILLSSCMPSTQFSEGRTRQNPIRGSSDFAPVYGGATWYWEIFVPPSDLNFTEDDIERIIESSSKKNGIITVSADLSKYIKIDRLIGPPNWTVTIEKASFLRIALSERSYRDGLDLIFAIKIPNGATLGKQSLHMSLKYLNKDSRVSEFTVNVLDKESD